MTLAEVYTALDSDLNELLGRLGSEALARRIVSMFPKDTSYQDLQKALEANDLDAAFMAAHTLKGLSMNMSFRPLGRSASALADVLREGQREPEKVPECMAQVTKDYEATLAALSQLE